MSPTCLTFRQTTSCACPPIAKASQGTHRGVRRREAHRDHGRPGLSRGRQGRENGLLVPARDAVALAEALERPVGIRPSGRGWAPRAALEPRPNSGSREWRSELSVPVSYLTWRPWVPCLAPDDRHLGGFSPEQFEAAHKCRNQGVH